MGNTIKGNQYLLVCWHPYHSLGYITGNNDGNVKTKTIILIFKNTYCVFYILTLGWMLVIITCLAPEISKYNSTIDA